MRMMLGDVNFSFYFSISLYHPAFAKYTCRKKHGVEPATALLSPGDIATRSFVFDYWPAWPLAHAKRQTRRTDIFSVSWLAFACSLLGFRRKYNNLVPIRTDLVLTCQRKDNEQKERQCEWKCKSISWVGILLVPWFWLVTDSHKMLFDNFRACVFRLPGFNPLIISTAFTTNTIFLFDCRAFTTVRFSVLTGACCLSRTTCPPSHLGTCSEVTASSTDSGMWLHIPPSWRTPVYADARLIVGNASRSTWPGDSCHNIFGRAVRRKSRIFVFFLLSPM